MMFKPSLALFKNIYLYTHSRHWSNILGMPLICFFNSTELMFSRGAILDSSKLTGMII